MLRLPVHSRPLAVTLGLCFLLTSVSRTVQAQDLFVTSDRTILLGNPINGDFSSVIVGTDLDTNPFPNVTADFTGGTVTNGIAAYNAANVTILDGVIGAVPADFTASTALGVFQGSTVTMTGGTLLSHVQVGNWAFNDGTFSTFTLSGGSAAYLFNGYGGVTNITGGSILGIPGNDVYPFGIVQNDNDGVLNITGGVIQGIFGSNFEGGIINFGGTALADRLTLSSFGNNQTANITGGTLGGLLVGSIGVANISGGTIGGDGIRITESGIVNLTGSGLTVNVTGVEGSFDGSLGVNLVITNYSLTGTLSDGTAIDATIRASGDYLNDGTSATFNGYGSAIAPDLFVQTDTTATGVYNNVHIGIDETLSVPSNPTVTIADGMDTVFLTTYADSATVMTGGIVRGNASVTQQSAFTLQGGMIEGFLLIGDQGAATVSGGSFGDVRLNGGTLTIQGSGLTGTGSAGTFWDGTNNYLLAGQFTVTGTLSDGTAFDRTILAGSVSGDGSQQTLVAAQVAPNVFQTADGTVSGFLNRVTIGQDETGVVNTSPTVALADGSDVGNVDVRNASQLTIEGGIVRGGVTVDPNAAVVINDGTIERVTGPGSVTVNGGSVTSINALGRTEILDGMIDSLNGNGANARIGVRGGSLRILTLFGAPAEITGGDIDTVRILNRGRADIRGGTVDRLRVSLSGTANIFGGTVLDVWGEGGIVNLYGGTIGSDTLLNIGLQQSVFNVYGIGLQLTNGTIGTYTNDFGQVFDGVWWDVTGLLQNGTTLNTRYFERNGAIGGANGLRLLAAAPEPGTLLLLMAGIPMMAAVRRRPRAVRRSSES
ncbi:MAG: PEP-CTERM sorting domain-containing protein [Capsulimonadales bacterium]|nr:PEP-CTERM sorting domain-containing protein [Capsulimonadales bacterium]